MNQNFDTYYDKDGLSLFYKKDRVLIPGLGNNAFSLNKKTNRENLPITPLRIGKIVELSLGEHTAFQDYDGDDWMECMGLKDSLLDLQSSVPIYVFDNHNHAFYGWCEGLNTGIYQKGATLIHLDAHFDDAEPKHAKVDLENMSDVWKYTNETLQIASFIKPAIELGIFDRVINYVESSDFSELPNLDPAKEVVLDIDLDVFCEEMSHVTWSEKVDVIKHYLPNTKLVTMATSPFFIDQKRAIDIAKRLMDEIFLGAY